MKSRKKKAPELRLILWRIRGGGPGCAGEGVQMLIANGWRLS